MSTKPARIFAEFLSHLFNPSVFGFLVLLVAALEEEAQTHPHFLEVLFYALLISLFFPLMYTLLLKRLKLIANFFYSKKKDRLYLFPMILIILISMLVIIRHFYASSAVITYLEMSLVLIALVAVITPFTKISLHMTGMTSLFVLCMYLWGSKGALIGFILPAVAWSRLYLSQHSAAQVVSGTLVGGSVTLAYLYTIEYLV